MNYLFIEAEKASIRGKLSMIEFGYVRTDEKFNVIEKNVFNMNPGERKSCLFSSSREVIKDCINIKFDEEFYYNQPQFNEFYERIKELVEDPNVKVISYDANKLVRIINDSCELYKLPLLKVDIYSAKIICDNLILFRPEETCLFNTFCHVCDASLYKDIIKDFKTDEEAFMVMKSLESICNNNSLTIEEALNFNPVIKSTNSTNKAKTTMSLDKELYKRYADKSNLKEYSKEEKIKTYFDYTFYNNDCLMIYSSKIKNENKFIEVCNNPNDCDYYVVYRFDDFASHLTIDQKEINKKIITLDQYMKMINYKKLFNI